MVNGTNPRPSDYSQIYRGTPPDFGFESLQLDPNQSLLFHIKESDINEEDLSIILNATNDYLSLLELQEDIIATVALNRTQAIETLSNDQYQKQKEKVLAPIVNFVSLQEERHQTRISDLSVRQDLYENIQKFLILLTVLFILTVIFLVNKFVVNPITKYFGKTRQHI